MAMKEAMGVAGRVDNRYGQSGRKLAVDQGVMVRATGMAEPVVVAAAQALVDVQRAWITLLQAAIPPIARPQFDAMIDEYTKKADALPQGS